VIKMMLGYLNRYQLSEIHLEYAQKLMNATDLVVDHDLNSYLESVVPNTPISTLNGRKPSLLSSGADPLTATRGLGEDMETTGDVITGIGIVTSPFGGGVLIVPGEITSGTGTAIQMLVD